MKGVRFKALDLRTRCEVGHRLLLERKMLLRLGWAVNTFHDCFSHLEVARRFLLVGKALSGRQCGILMVNAFHGYFDLFARPHDRCEVHVGVHAQVFRW